ncbi:hypothetical protein PWT90_01323 [Aphanocladium album]|nr:hypothetical protein PWT90_01323 [Aphanocladium album]
MSGVAVDASPPPKPYANAGQLRTVEVEDLVDKPCSSSRQEKHNAVAVNVEDMDIWAQLELEKSRYPGASTWAPEEEHLFELLFCRQDLPILPLHWELDLSGVPISGTNFAALKSSSVVYAHGKDFLALVRLIELTAAIRTTSESGLHHRVPAMIKDGVEKFLAWAAEDGGYSHLRVVPNIITEIVDMELRESDITAFLQGRMRALARLQREFLREDRDPNFWAGTSGLGGADAEYDDEARCAAADRNEMLLQRYLSPRKNRGYNSRRKVLGRRRRSDHSMEDELAGAAPDSDTPSKSGAAFKRRRTFASPTNDLDELSKAGDSSSDMHSSPPSERREAKRLFSSPSTTGTGHSSSGSPTSAAPIKYRRRPPVVYGLFILNSSVLILTVDSSLDDTAYVSFHVETDFMEQHQSVWNALTLAMVSCLARDQLRERSEDFEPQEAGEDESDPDV